METPLYCHSGELITKQVAQNEQPVFYLRSIYGVSQIHIDKKRFVYRRYWAYVHRYAVITARYNLTVLIFLLSQKVLELRCDYTCLTAL